MNELNENLAGWYYVISNEVYEKIRLERKDFVRIKKDDAEARPEEVKASHILISFKGADRADAEVTRSKEEAKAEAQRIRDLIVNEGKDFAEMAQEHSNGPSKTKGGDLGKFKFEVMAKPFSEAAFALEVGAVSEVVETGFGFHVIKEPNKKLLDFLPSRLPDVRDQAGGLLKRRMKSILSTLCLLLSKKRNSPLWARIHSDDATRLRLVILLSYLREAVRDKWSKTEGIRHAFR